MTRWTFSWLLLAPSLVPTSSEPHSQYLRRHQELMPDRSLRATAAQPLNVDGLVERMDCLPYDEIAQSVKDAPQTQANYGGEGACDGTGSCGANTGGCCRMIDFLTCDPDNTLYILPCVCNEQTRIRGVNWGPNVTYTLTYEGQTVAFDIPAQTVPLAGGGFATPGQAGEPLAQEANVDGGGGGGGGGGKGKDKDKGKSKSKDDTPTPEEGRVSCPVGQVCINGVPVQREGTGAFP